MLRTQKENITHDLDVINNTFRDFYKTSYSSQNDPPDSNIDQFLSNIKLPKLQVEKAMALDLPLSIGELHEEQHMPSNKARGLDGFPAELYKEFWTVLAPTFAKMVLQVQENGRLSPNMNSVNIILLQKPGKYLVVPSSYHPISLINADLKITCKALTKRIEKITPLIMHPVPGFIKGRHSSSNTCRLINLIDYSTINNHNRLSRCRKSI